jgi:CheY-like chemotaxis protein
MPAPVVVVHDDPSVLNGIVSALHSAGYDATGFRDSMSALDALESARRIDVLVTRVRLSEGHAERGSTRADGANEASWREGPLHGTAGHGGIYAWCRRDALDAGYC